MAVVLRPGDSNDLVRLLQAHLNRDYPLYSRPKWSTASTGRAPLQWSKNSSAERVCRSTASRVRRPSGGSAELDQPPPLPTNLPFFYNAAGTWSTPFMSPQFDVGWRLEQLRQVRNQPVGYPAAGFLYPNPFMSYNESVALGVANSCD